MAKVPDRYIFLAQALFTLTIFAAVENNLIKTGLLLLLWGYTFWPLSKKETLVVVIANLVFIVNDYLAITNGFFQFTSPDFLKLPAWEFFMWGFYLLHTSRLFPNKTLKKFNPWVLGFALLFSQSFGLIADRMVLLAVTSTLLIAMLAVFRTKNDFKYSGYLMAFGAVTETIGLTQNYWVYPNEVIWRAACQFVVMWGGIGVLYYRLIGPFLFRNSETQQAS